MVYHANDADEFVKRYSCHPSCRSKLWKYIFGFLADDNGQVIYTLNEAICELCDEQVKCSNNTTNLMAHLKCHHLVQLINKFGDKKGRNARKPVSRRLKAIKPSRNDSEKGGIQKRQCKVFRMSKCTSFLYL